MFGAAQCGNICAQIICGCATQTMHGGRFFIRVWHLDIALSSIRMRTHKSPHTAFRAANDKLCWPRCNYTKFRNQFTIIPHGRRNFSRPPSNVVERRSTLHQATGMICAIVCDAEPCVCFCVCLAARRAHTIAIYISTVAARDAMCVITVGAAVAIAASRRAEANAKTKRPQLNERLEQTGVPV